MEFPKTKREISGLVLILVGGAMCIFGGLKIGKNIGIYAQYRKDNMEAIYYNLTSTPIDPEEGRNFRNGLYLGTAGLSSILLGLILSSSRRFSEYKNDETKDYKSLYSQSRDRRTHIY